MMCRYDGLFASRKTLSVLYIVEIRRRPFCSLCTIQVADFDASIGLKSGSPRVNYSCADIDLLVNRERNETDPEEVVVICYSVILCCKFLRTSHISVKLNE